MVVVAAVMMRLLSRSVKASGDLEHGEVSDRIRDVSVIRDALLKTKSQIVLMDKINKNGLQMLHNMLKQKGRSYLMYWLCDQG